MPFYLTVGIPYGLVNLWILWWFWRGLRGASFLQWAACIALVCLAAAFPLWYRRPGASYLDIAVLRAGAAWLGVFPYVFFMILAAEAATILSRRAGRGWFPTPRICLAALVLALCVGIAGWLAAAAPTLRQYAVAAPSKSPVPPALVGKTLTIGMVSDLHLGRIISAARLARAVALLAPHKPDILFFLGDILDDHFLLDEAAMREAVALVSPRLGTWGILGNHEYISGNASASGAILEKCGVSILRDDWTVLDNAVLVVGRDDYSRQRFTARQRKTLAQILEQVPREYRELPLIVLDHQPRRLEEAEAAGAALQLSGHTHNGQLWPFNYITDHLYENPWGLSTRGGTTYIVSLGAGTWGPPMRTNARPEAALVRISFAPAAESSD
jgi:predicted MPP superfamily phosphohydrolase